MTWFEAVEGARPASGRRAVIALALAPVTALPGCILDNASFDGAETSAASSTSSTADAATSLQSTSGTTSGAPTTSDATSSDAATSDAASVTGSATTSGSTGEPTTSGGEEVHPVHSCAELQDQLESEQLPVVSGIYWILTPVSEEPVRVYCDLEIVGGGWLLAGRSTAAGAPGSFGWRAATGDLDDDALPYSLDLALHPFPFTEILIGTAGAGKTWGELVYHIQVPPGFVDGYVDQFYGTVYVGALKGPCTPPGGPTMFDFTGVTAKTNTFWFRDKAADNADFGLTHVGFDTYYDNCPQGGLLKGLQGMVMVR